MCDYEVDVAEICAAFGEEPDNIFPAQTLARLEEDGLIRTDHRRVTMRPAARPLVRAVAAAFDAHRARGERRHAPAV